MIKTPSGILVPTGTADRTPARPDLNEVASSRDGRDITRGYIDPMLVQPPDDSVLMQRGGGDYSLYREVLRDDRVKTALQQRFHAVISRPWEVRPGGEKRIDKQAAEHLKEQLAAIAWDEKTVKMLYGVFYGHAVAEAMWGIDAGRVVLADIKVRDRRRFGFDGENRLRLKTSTNANGELMPDRKFWAFATGADHDDAPYGLGLAHWLYWPVWFKRNGLRFWAVFLEKFGTPTAVGKFMPGTSSADQSRLLAALRAIQRDSAIIFPDGMQAELLEAKRGGTADHAAFVDAMNQAITIIGIGQTASTNGTPGKLGNDDTQNDVRIDLVKADADLVCMSFNATIAKWLTEWNFPGAAVPQVWRLVEEPEDLKTRAERDEKISGMGFKPSLAYVTETYGGEWEVAAPRPLPAPGTPGAPAATPAPAEFAEGDALDAPDQTAIDTAIDATVANLAEVADEFMAPIVAAVMGAVDYAEAFARLAELWPQLDSREIERRLGNALTAAEAWGRLSVKAES